MHWDRDTAEALTEQEDRTLRDSHGRCTICGRPPGEACCGTCHMVAQTFEEQRKQAMRDRGLATWRQNLHPEGVNTEAVNQ